MKQESQRELPIVLHDPSTVKSHVSQDVWADLFAYVPASQELHSRDPVSLANLPNLIHQVNKSMSESATVNVLKTTKRMQVTPNGI